MGKEGYHDLVAPGSYLVAIRGITRDPHGDPQGDESWKYDHSTEASEGFVARHPDIVLEQPKWPFNERELRTSVTHRPGAWLRRRED